MNTCRGEQREIMGRKRQKVGTERGLREIAMSETMTH